MKKNKKTLTRIIVISILIFFLFLLTFSLVWASLNYGNIGMSEILFHLKMPLEGTSSDLIQSYINDALLPTITYSVLGIILFSIISLFDVHVEVRTKYSERRCFIKLKKIHIIANVGLLVWFGILLYMGDQEFGLYDFVINKFQESKFIEEEYVDPRSVSISAPTQKRNLITIFVESGETTAFDYEHGGSFEANFVPEMVQIADANISFSQTELLNGASLAPNCGWTIAGLVAQTSGLPLKVGIFGDNFTGNSMDEVAYFLPKVVSLGDILEEQGYHNYFMAGSDFDFGGRTNYFTQHGGYEIWDYYSAIEEGKISEGYYVWWGFEDQKLYEYAQEKLLMLSQQNEPFNFSMITVDTHHENGYVCGLCESTYEEQYQNVWSCASKQLASFVDWIKQQDFYENTTIVIVGDHASMDSDFYNHITDFSAERLIYNAFINAAVDPENEKNRDFTTLDMFPTILASLGFEIEGDRLGLGTNLFSDQETLFEKYGYDYCFAELNKESSFYNDLLVP